MKQNCRHPAGSCLDAVRKHIAERATEHAYTAAEHGAAAVEHAAQDAVEPLSEHVTESGAAHAHAIIDAHVMEMAEEVAHMEHSISDERLELRVTLQQRDMTFQEELAAVQNELFRLRSPLNAPDHEAGHVADPAFAHSAEHVEPLVECASEHAYIAAEHVFEAAGHTKSIVAHLENCKIQSDRPLLQ